MKQIFWVLGLFVVLAVVATLGVRAQTGAIKPGTYDKEKCARLDPSCEPQFPKDPPDCATLTEAQKVGRLCIDTSVQPISVPVVSALNIHLFCLDESTIPDTWVPCKNVDYKGKMWARIPDKEYAILLQPVRIEERVPQGFFLEPVDPKAKLVPPKPTMPPPNGRMVDVDVTKGALITLPEYPKVEVKEIPPADWLRLDNAERKLKAATDKIKDEFGEMVYTVDGPTVSDLMCWHGYTSVEIKGRYAIVTTKMVDGCRSNSNPRPKP